MIIPLLDAGVLSAQVLIETIGYWSLLGRIAVQNTGAILQSELVQVVQNVGGIVDLLIKADDQSEANLLGLLNAGASSVFNHSQSPKPYDSIPEPCWLTLTDLESNPRSEWKRGNLVSIGDPTPARVAELDRLGLDVLVDIRFLEQEPAWLADFFQFVLTSDRPDQLWPTVIVDELGLVLGLAYSNYASLLDAIANRRGTYWSRSRNELWVKGATSGNEQRLLGLRLDCDRDALQFQVSQRGSGFCHLDTYSCFGHQRNIVRVIQRLNERCHSSDVESFTKKLVTNPAMLRAKLLEEAQELAEAQSKQEVAFEAADLLYFTLVKMVSAGVELPEVYGELARRMTRVIRRENKLESEENLLA